MLECVLYAKRRPLAALMFREIVLSELNPAASSPPPPPTRTHKGPHACSHFLGKGGTFWAFVSGRFPEQAGKGYYFVSLSITEIGLFSFQK